MKMTRREALQGVAVLAATEVVEKTTDGGFAAVTLPGVPSRRVPVLPPSATSQREFSLRCVGCGICTRACPEGVLRLSTEWRNFGLPTMDFRFGYCRLACGYRCGEVCPTGALSVPKGYARRDVRSGYALWHKDLCLRTTTGEACTACVRKCPVKAIHLVEGFPVVDRGACVGCGACEHVCPSRPLPAISVEGVVVTPRTKPMDEETLVAELKHLVATGVAVATGRGGLVESWESGHGVEPLLKLLAAGKLEGRIVVDKVIGRAAAAVCIVGGARKVCAPVMSEDAKTLLDAYGIANEAESLVPKILNRDRTAGCPLESLVESLSSPEEMVAALRNGRTE